jgi:ABC-type glutathione transport system ATPase component
MLFGHLFDFDKKNENKNVIIFFGEEDALIKSYDKLYKKSKETVPFLIIVDKSNYIEKLNYVNHIPDLATIENILKKEKQTFSEDELSTLSEKALIYYINMKLFRIDMYYNQLGYNLNLINPMNEIYLKIKANVTIGLFGYSGCGKSTLINLVFNELVARTSTSSTDVT